MQEPSGGKEARAALMRFSLSIMSLWPGFFRAWVLARWEGLVLAVALAAEMNSALVATLAWDSNTNSRLPAVATTAWVLVLGLWTLGIAWLRRDWSQLRTRTNGAEDHEHEELFREALRLYLKGHWLEAEAIAKRLIARQPLDVESRLLLSSVLRRTRKWREARKTLIDLREDAAAGRWLLEIEMDIRQIDEMESERESGELSQLGQAQAA